MKDITEFLNIALSSSTLNNMKDNKQTFKHHIVKKRKSNAFVFLIPVKGID